MVSFSISVVEFESWNFIVCDAPTDQTLSEFANVLGEYQVKHVVRACDPTYSADLLEKKGFVVHSLPFPDGASPPAKTLEKWRQILKSVEAESCEVASSKEESRRSKSKTVAVHCVAGLGRSPTLVAVALIDRGMDATDAVELLRKKRRGAINSAQLSFLVKYRPVNSSPGPLAAIRSLLTPRKWKDKQSPTNTSSSNNSDMIASEKRIPVF